MARVTVEDSLRRVANRFMLVHAAAGRVRQMREGSQYLVHSPKNEDVVVALREIAAGKVLIGEGPPQKQLPGEAAAAAESPAGEHAPE